MFSTPFRGFLLAVTCLLVVGCSADKGEVPVAGHLTRGGKPCEGVGITFVPDDMATPGYTGGTNPDGSFVMFSFKGKKGVMPGVYKVQITVPLDAVGGGLVKKELLGADSPWRITVTDKGFADLQLDMDKEKLE